MINAIHSIGYGLITYISLIYIFGAFYSALGIKMTQTVMIGIKYTSFILGIIVFCLTL